MTTRTIRFEPVTCQGRKNLPCPDCGKKVRRQKTFQMTISPFNKNPDGTIRTRPEVFAAVREKAIAWEAEPERCTPCDDIWLAGRSRREAHRAELAAREESA